MIHRFLAALLLFAPCSEAAKGVLLAKSYSFEPTSKAAPIEYASCERFNTVFNVITPTGNRRTIATGLIVRDIRYEEIICPSQLITPADAQSLSQRIATISKTISQWPESEKFLNLYLERNRAALAAYEKGFVLSSNKWQTRESYQRDIDERNRRAAEQRIREIEESERQRAAMAKIRAQKQAEAEMRIAEAQRVAAENQTRLAAEKAEANRRAEEERLRKRASFGRAPDRDRLEPGITRYLQKVLNDPDSLKIDGITEPYLSDSGWIVGCNYGAKNGFGGMVRKSEWFVFAGPIVFRSLPENAFNPE